MKKHNIQLSKPSLTWKEYTKGIQDANRVILSQAITLVESANSKHQKLALEIIKHCLPYSGKSIRVGITGVPGSGKSTFIEALGKYLTNKNHKVAVLAIDPSSTQSKGSILGDKTRMEELAADENAFIRPSPSVGTLGGVAATTRETIILCEAAGYDIIFIETIGVGQSEVAVHAMVDFFLLLMLSGAGDELQGIKRGIMEMADMLVINKADGDNKEKAELTKRQYESTLHYFPVRISGTGWTPKVEICSAQNKTGIEKIWNTILEHQQLLKENGFFAKKRQKQSKYWMYETINTMVKQHFYNNKEVSKTLKKIEKQVLQGKMSSIVAANEMMERYKQ